MLRKLCPIQTTWPCIYFAHESENVEPELRQPRFLRNRDSPKKLAKFIDDFALPESSLTFLVNHETVAKQAVSEKNEGHFFKKLLFPKVTDNNQNDLLQAASSIVTNFNISRKKYQSIIRNQVNLIFEKVLWTNIYPPREHVFRRISEVKTQITEAIGLKFSEPK